MITWLDQKKFQLQFFQLGKNLFWSEVSGLYLKGFLVLFFLRAGPTLNAWTHMAQLIAGRAFEAKYLQLKRDWNQK